MAIIQGHAKKSTVSGFYNFPIEQSLRFNDDDSAYLSWTPASAGNRKTWTWSSWVKRCNLGSSSIFMAGNVASSADVHAVVFRSDDKLQFFLNESTVTKFNKITTQVFRDTSAWYHFVVVSDTSNATAEDRLKIYVNGERITSFSSNSNPSQNEEGYWSQSGINQYIGRSNAGYADQYLAEVNFIDGSALDPTSFGELKNGVWIPKDPSGLTYGTNGFYLDFANSADIGNDVSGEGNDWTPNNFTASDVVLDSPTDNFCTLNSALSDSHFNTSELSNGNLFYNEGQGNNGDGRPTGTFSVTSGKWYWEVQVPSQQNSRAIGFTRTDNIGKGDVTLHGAGFTSTTSVVGIDLSDDTIDQVNAAGTHTQHASGLTGMADNDIFGISVDLDGGTFQMYRNGSTYGSSYSLSDLSDWQTYGMTPTASAATYQAFRFNFGQSGFTYTPPTGYLALSTANLPDPVIDPAQGSSPEDYFNTVLYTGNGTSKAVTGVGFQPDFVWAKNRTDSAFHILIDSVRGATKRLFSDATNAESTSANSLTSFDSDGFTVGSDNTVNGSSDAIVAWNWKANGSGVSNTDGSITSTVSANTTSGFSIVTYTGNGTNGATVGHGLSQEPEFVIVKPRDQAENWNVQTDGKRLNLNLTGSAATNYLMTFNSDTVTLTDLTYQNGNGYSMLMYAFHSVEGFSKFGSYVGNGSADGPFIYTGFKPKWFLWKRVDGLSGWSVYDAERDPYNYRYKILYPDGADAEGTPSAYYIDFVSNGIKIRGNGTAYNTSGSSVIYMAFAENPFKYSTAS